MKTNRAHNLYTSVVVLLLMSTLMLCSCLKEQVPGTYYSFSGQTVADFLENDESNRFTEFIDVLKKAKRWGELQTYGEYTCFAPTNDAFDAYLEQRGMKSVEDLSIEDCDTISRTHIIKATFFLSDLSEGAIPQVNQLDRFLTISYDSAQVEDGRFRLRTCINKNCHVIQLNDTAQNGVVHVLDSVIKVAGDYIYDILDDNPDASIFFQAMKQCKLEDSLKVWQDYSYSCGYDSVYEGIVAEAGTQKYHVYYWGERRTCWTILVEPDSVYRKAGINNFDDLLAYAIKVYDTDALQEFRVAYDPDSLQSRNHPLNRFVSYHILPFQVASEQNFNLRSDLIEARSILNTLDPEDYFETYMPHSIIRFSTVYRTGDDEKGVYINRRSLGGSRNGEIGKPYVRGIKVYTTDQMKNVANEACNGYFHYIDGILTYDNETRTDVLSRRMRIDCSTLSPDFMTSGARQSKPGSSSENEAKGFKDPLNFKSYNPDYMMWIRCAVTTNWSFEGDAVDIVGNFDLLVKLPPVPFDGTYELRLSYRGLSNCGVVQNYVGDDINNLSPCGIPTDLTINAAENPNIGWISDSDLMEEGGQEKVEAHDKAMHNRGYMKGPDSFKIDPANGGDPFRDVNTMARRIVTTDYFYANKDYYLRMKLVSTNKTNPELNFDYMEWCPKNIYDNEEDKH